MQVIVDTSVWIDYFKGGAHSSELDFLIDENLVATNEVVLAELVPFLRLKKQNRLIELLGNVSNVPMSIDWNNIIDLQVECLRSGVNGVGIPDLIIAQNALFHHCAIYSLDKHFRFLNDVVKLKCEVDPSVETIIQ